MSRSATNVRTQAAAFAGLQPVSTQELEQIFGGFEATLLTAMGWKSFQQTYMDKNGMCYTKTFWVPPPKPA